jgi:hypothetical protein
MDKSLHSVSTLRRLCGRCVMEQAPSNSAGFADTEASWMGFVHPPDTTINQESA